MNIWFHTYLKNIVEYTNLCIYRYTQIILYSRWFHLETLISVNYKTAQTYSTNIVQLKKIDLTRWENVELLLPLHS